MATKSCTSWNKWNPRKNETLSKSVNWCGMSSINNTCTPCLQGSYATRREEKNYMIQNYILWKHILDAIVETSELVSVCSNKKRATFKETCHIYIYIYIYMYMYISIYHETPTNSFKFSVSIIYQTQYFSLLSWSNLGLFGQWQLLELGLAKVWVFLLPRWLFYVCDIGLKYKSENPSVSMKLCCIAIPTKVLKYDPLAT